MISRTSYVNNSIKFSFNDACCKRSIDNASRWNFNIDDNSRTVGFPYYPEIDTIEDNSVFITNIWQISSKIINKGL